MCHLDSFARLLVTASQTLRSDLSPLLITLSTSCLTRQCLVLTPDICLHENIDKCFFLASRDRVLMHAPQLQIVWFSLCPQSSAWQWSWNVYSFCLCTKTETERRSSSLNSTGNKQIPMHASLATITSHANVCYKLGFAADSKRDICCNKWTR